MSHIIEEYPKMVFKTRTEHKTVNSLEEEEAALSDGFGEYDVVILKKKPASVIEAEKREALKAEVRAELEKESASKKVEAPKADKAPESDKKK